MPNFEMSTYSSNTRNIPRVFIGDRGFLKRYGSQFTEAEISSIYEYAISRSNFGACAGDETTAEVLSQLKKSYEFYTMYHTRFLLSLGKLRKITPLKLAATLRYYYGEVLNSVFEKNDSIISAFLNQGAKESPLSRRDICQITEDCQMMERDLQCIYKLRPTLITIGGDWFDLAIACGLDDLVHRIIKIIHQATLKNNTIILLFSYMYPLMDRYQSFIDLEYVHGLFCPMNISGNGMPPDKETALQVISKIDKLKVGMHLLGGGTIPVLPALDFAINHQRLDSVVVGVSSQINIDSLVAASKQCFFEVE